MARFNHLINMDDQNMNQIEAGASEASYRYTVDQSSLRTVQDNAYLPLIDVSDVELKFAGVEEAKEWMFNQRMMKEYLHPSYPSSAHAQIIWVKAIMKAFQNFDNVSDGEKLIKQWRTMLLDKRFDLEIIAWKFLGRVMYYHRIEGQLEPSNAESKNAAKWESFADHMNFMLNAFSIKKTLCRHLATDIWTATFIDAPALHSSRVDNNKKINTTKKLKVAVGQKALAHVVKKQDGVCSAEEAEQDAAQVIDLMAQVPKTRSKRAATINTLPAAKKPRKNPTTKKATSRKSKTTIKNVKNVKVKEEPDSDHAWAEDAITAITASEQTPVSSSTDEMEQLYAGVPLVPCSNYLSAADHYQSGIENISQYTGNSHGYGHYQYQAPNNAGRISNTTPYTSPNMRSHASLPRLSQCQAISTYAPFEQQDDSVDHLGRYFDHYSVDGRVDNGGLAYDTPGLSDGPTSTQTSTSPQTPHHFIFYQSGPESFHFNGATSPSSPVYSPIGSAGPSAANQL